MIKLELIEEAYRKLKGSVYWDKTLPFLRASIVTWENENLDSKAFFEKEKNLSDK